MSDFGGVDSVVVLDDLSIDQWANKHNMTLGEAISVILIYSNDDSFNEVPTALRKTLARVSDAEIREAMETYTDDRESRNDG